jgi:hypothetical protein
MGRQGPVAWPPRSPDLTPLYCCLWGRMKSLVYAVKSSARAELLNLIMDSSVHITDDQPSLFRSLTSISLRATVYMDDQGGHCEHLLH